MKTINLTEMQELFTGQGSTAKFIDALQEAFARSSEVLLISDGAPLVVLFSPERVRDYVLERLATRPPTTDLLSRLLETEEVTRPPEVPGA